MADKKISALTAVTSLSSTDVFPVVQGSQTKKAAISDIKNYLPTASSINTGLLTYTDWNTFNNKQSALTFGNLSESTSSVLTISGGTGSIIGSGVTLQVKQASGSQSGYLSSSDWTTFNSKQSSLTLTTTGTSGAATLVGATLNIPQYSGGGITSLNSQSGSSQSFATATTGTDFSISSVSNTHTFAIPSASASNRGLLTSTDWSTFNSKEPALTKGNLTESTSSVLTISGGTGSVIGSGTSIQVKRATASVDGYLKATDFSTFAGKQDALTLTTTGTSGAATLTGSTLNIPQYSGGGGSSGYIATVTLATFISDASGGLLTAGGWYQVTDCGPSTSYTFSVFALDNTNYSRHVYYTEPNYNQQLLVEVPDLAGEIYRYHDGAGNTYNRLDLVTGTPALVINDPTYISNCNFLFPAIYDNSNDCALDSCTFSYGNYDLSKLTAISSQFINSNTINTTGYNYNVNFCSFNNTIIEQNNSGGTINIENVKFNNCYIYLEDNQDISISNCSFENCTLYFYTAGGALTVENLSITGKGQSETMYHIDGTFQASVKDNWAGKVVADNGAENYGTETYSTVTCIVELNSETNQNNLETTSNSLYLIDNSIVGIYLLPDATTTINYIYDSTNQLNHAILLKPQASDLNIDFNLIPYSDTTLTIDLGVYQNYTSNIGKLNLKPDWIKIKQEYNNKNSNNCWIIIDGQSYD